MNNIVGIKINKTGKFSYFINEDLELSTGDLCVVETERGLELGTVLLTSVKEDRYKTTKEMKTVLRIASENDILTDKELKETENEAFLFCRERIKERELDMKLVAVNFTLDKSKAVFYFTADGRIDFRELVKDLAHKFHLRIEMRQIGVRDEAKMIGGLSTCGRELCCSTFLNKFAPVSIKMAKAQQLILNPNRISGTCGRLMCCISYETENECSSCDNSNCHGKQNENLKYYEENN
jgi:cell fate regulator YaaT (PSP1 superfamily)